MGKGVALVPEPDNPHNGRGRALWNPAIRGPGRLQARAERCRISTGRGACRPPTNSRRVVGMSAAQIAAVAALAAVVLAGCGSASTTTTPSTSSASAATTAATPTAAEYAARVNNICREYRARAKKAPGETATTVTATTLALAITENEALYREKLAEEAAVPAPAGKEQIVKSLIAALRRKQALEHRVVLVAAREGNLGLVKLQEPLAVNGGEVLALDKQLGLTVCGKH